MQHIMDDETEAEESRGVGSLLAGVAVIGGLVAALMSHNPLAPTVQAVPNQSYVALARQDAVNAGINPTWFVKQIQQESGFDPNAVSPAGAIGIAQFMPATAESMGIDPHDPEASLKAAAHLDAANLAHYGSEEKALAAYNAGSGTVDSAIAQCGTAWESCLPHETQVYISAIER